MKERHSFTFTERESDMAKFKIINNIRRFRFDRDEMTQKELANQAGVTRQTIMAIEAGKYSPSLELAFHIADAFGVKIGEVFGYEVEKEKKKSEHIKD